MRKHCSDVCKLRPCLNKESKNSVRLRTIVTAALQRQYSQTELIFWISLVHTSRSHLWTEGHCHEYLQTCVTNYTNIFRLAPNLETSIYLYIYKFIPKKPINVWNKSGEFNFLLCRIAFGRMGEILHPTKLASRKLRLWNINVLLKYGLRQRWKKILKQMLNCNIRRLWNGFMWLRIQASGGLLRIRYRISVRVKVTSALELALKAQRGIGIALLFL